VDPSGEPPVQSEIAHSRLLVYVRELNGETINGLALVTVTRMANQYWQQMTTQGGRASFDDISPGRYTVQTIAAGYEKAVEELEIVGGGGQSVIVSLRPESPGGEATPVVPDPPLLAAKAQKELAKALEALRVGKLAEARKHLDAAYRLAPSHPDVNFGFGVYSSQVNDWQQARSYWEKAITFYPQHLLAQISLSDALLRENKPTEAIPHLEKALEIEPNSWRVHAFLADADLRLGSSEEAVRQAERAIALGKERAAVIRPLLARRSWRKGRPTVPCKFWNLILQNILRTPTRKSSWPLFARPGIFPPFPFLLYLQRRRFR